MPTKDQYEFFKQTLTEEDARTSLLVKRGEIYLSLISLFLTGLVFKFGDLKASLAGNIPAKLIFSIVLLSLFGAAVFTILSLQIRNYTGVNVGKWTDELGASPPTDYEFYINRIADFIAVKVKNQQVNNKKAAQLKYAGYLLLFTVLSIGSLLFIILVV